MKIISKILVLTIFSVVLQSNSETADTYSKSNGIGASTNNTIEISARACECGKETLKNPNAITSPSESSYVRERKSGNQHHHKWRRPHHSNRKRREVPAEHHEHKSLTTEDPDAQIIPSEWILKYCFKQTPLEHYMNNKMQSCEPKGTDFSCMFSLETEEDSLESRFDRLYDHELRLPLKRAVATCRERHERQSLEHEEVSPVQDSEQPLEDQPKQTDGTKESVQTENFVDPVTLNRVLMDLDRDAFNLTVVTPTPQEREYKPKRGIKRIPLQHRRRFHKRSQRSVTPIKNDESDPVDDLQTEKLSKDPTGQNAMQLKITCVEGCDHSDLFYPQNENNDQQRPLIKIERNPSENEEEIGVGKSIEVRITLDKNAKEGLDEYVGESRIQDDDIELPEVGIGLDDVKGRSDVKEYISFTGKGNESSERNEHPEISSCIAKEVIKVCKPKLLRAISMMLN